MHPIAMIAVRAVSWYVRLLLFGIPTFILVFLSIRSAEWLARMGYANAVDPHAIASAISYTLLALNAFVLICRPRGSGLGRWSAWADRFFDVPK